MVSGKLFNICTTCCGKSAWAAHSLDKLSTCKKKGINVKWVNFMPSFQFSFRVVYGDEGHPLLWNQMRKLKGAVS